MKKNRLVLSASYFMFLVVAILLLSCGDEQEESAYDKTTQAQEASIRNDTTSEAPPQKEKLQFKILVDASPEVVYQTLINNEHFKTWTSVFQPTSHCKGSWEQGSTMYFLSLDDKGNTMGLISKVKENRPNEFLSLEHYGMIYEGQEILDGEDIEAIKGSVESYTFTPQNGKTEILVETEIFTDLRDYFLDTWPSALEALKKICEGSENRN